MTKNWPSGREAVPLRKLLGPIMSLTGQKKERHMRIRQLLVRFYPLVFVTVMMGFLVVPAVGFASPASQQGQQESRRLQLSLEEAVRLALRQNLDIAFIDYDRDIAHQSIITAEGLFDPILGVGTPGTPAVVGTVASGFGQTAPLIGGVGFSSSESPSTTALAGASVSESQGFGTQVRFTQQFDFGFNYQLGYNIGRSTSNSTFTNLNPSWNNTFGFAFAQPLLRGRGKEASGAQLLLAKRNAEVSAHVFRTQVETVLFGVVQTYWELVFARRNLEVSERSLQLAQDQLGRTQVQVEVGMLAPIEETQAEVAVAQRRNELIIARNGVEDATDNLKVLLKAESLPDGWETVIDLTDAPEITPRQADIDEEIQTALANRPEIATARAQIAARQVEVNVTRNSMLPALDVVGGISFVGVGGDTIVREPFPGQKIIEILPGGYGDALSALYGFGFSTWRVGFNFSMPIGNTTAKGNYAQATLNEDKARTELERTEQQAILEVRQAVRAVAAAGELMVSTAKTRELAEQQLTIEQDRFDVGMSTNFEVLAFQDELRRAQAQELRAMIDYRNAQALLSRVTGAITEAWGIQIQ